MPKELEEMLDAFITREEDEIEMSAFFQTWARIEAERPRGSAVPAHAILIDTTGAGRGTVDCRRPPAVRHRRRQDRGTGGVR